MMKTEAEVRALFTLAGAEVQRVWKLPNGYVGELEPLTDNEITRDTPGSEGYVETVSDKTSTQPTKGVVKNWMADYRWRVNRPAWLVKTSQGLIELTERKRVLSIDWRETNIRKIVTQDDVTKSETMVHAWDDGTAIKYLQALLTNN